MQQQAPRQKAKNIQDNLFDLRLTRFVAIRKLSTKMSFKESEEEDGHIQ